MATKLFDVTLTNILNALSANTYYWIDPVALATSAGGAVLAGTVLTGTQLPVGPQVIDLSAYLGVELVIEHNALTSEVGGKVSVAELVPDNAFLAGTPIVLGATTIDTNLAATAESLVTPIVNPPTLRRLARVAIGVIFTTVPSVGNVCRLSLWGVRGVPQE